MYDYMLPDYEWIKVRDLSQLINPLEGCFDHRVHDHLVVGREQVDHCMHHSIFDAPYANPRIQIDLYHKLTMSHTELIAHHAARIAWFVQHQSKTHRVTWPIMIHVHHNPQLKYPWSITILDGRHRLAAHIYAYRHTIAAFINGDPDHVAMFVKQYQSNHVALD